MANHHQLVKNLNQYINKRGQIIKPNDTLRARKCTPAENIFEVLDRRGNPTGQMMMAAKDHRKNDIWILTPYSFWRNHKLTLNRMLNAHNTIIQIERVEHPHPLRQVIRRLGPEATQSIGEKIFHAAKTIILGWFGYTIPSVIKAAAGERVGAMIAQQVAAVVAEPPIAEQIADIVKLGAKKNDELSRTFGKARQVQEPTAFGSVVNFFTTKSHATTAFEAQNVEGRDFAP